LKALGIDKLAFDSDVIASTQGPEIVDVSRLRVVRYRYCNGAPAAGPDIEDAEFVVDSFNSSFNYVIAERRRRSSTGDAATSSRLNGLLDANRIHIPAVTRCGPKGDTVARFEILRPIFHVVVSDPGIEIISQTETAAICRDHAQFLSRSIDLGHFRGDFTGTQTGVCRCWASGVAGTNFV
jgi:hypothetical protein